MAVHDIRYYLNGILFVAEGKKLDAWWPPTATAWRCRGHARRRSAARRK